MSRLDYLRHSTCAHRLADRHGRHVAFPILHPASLGGVERKVEVSDQNLTLGRLGNGCLPILEILLSDAAIRPFGQDPLSVGVHAAYTLT